MVTFLRIIGWLVVIGMIVTGALLWRGYGAGPIPQGSAELMGLHGEAREKVLARGEWVWRAADCAACHTDPEGGSDLAGGMPMVTPMGTIYGTNISASKEYGIGWYSADDLYRAVAWGVAPGNRNLYPAMPYASYHAITREDSDALYLWIMDQPAVEKPSRPAEMMFPFNLRLGVSLWNALFRPKAAPYPSSHAEGDDQPPGQNIARGRYLTEVLGHCGECHSPRNIAFAMTTPHLGGNVIEGAYAPDLRGAALVARGWNGPDLVDFLHRGLSPQGVMTFRMFPVLSHSTSHLPIEDLQDITAYLLAGETPHGPQVLAPRGTPDPQGHDIYMGLCAGCHGKDGEGQPHSSVPLDTNTTAMFPEPVNLIRVIREGVPERELAQGERMQAMPAYGAILSDAQMVQLVSYMRQRWGGQEAITEADLRAANRQIEAAEH